MCMQPKPKHRANRSLLSLFCVCARREGILPRATHMLGPLVRLFSSAVTASSAPPTAGTAAIPPGPYPPILYGTAWKKERTCELVLLALKCGFRAIDTACQPKHYNEAGVGEAVERSRPAESRSVAANQIHTYSGPGPITRPI